MPDPVSAFSSSTRLSLSQRSIPAASHQHLPVSDFPNPGRVIFFDLAQTLVTTTAQSPRRLVASKLALSEKAVRKVGRCMMTFPALEPSSLAQALGEILDHSGRQHLEQVLKAVWTEQRHCVRAIDGAKTVLESLKASGLKLGLLSNTWHPLYTSFLENCPELAELLDYSILSYRLGSKKPSPAIFQHALAEAKAPPEQCWMVGDSYELDIEPAMMAGLHTIWVLHRPETERPLLAQLLRGEKPRPDWSVAHLSEVLAYFSKKGSL